MKNIKILFLVIFLSVSYLSLGQNNKFSIGAEGGPSLIFLYGDNDKTHLWIGFSGGSSFQCNFNKTISLYTSISYERKGFSDRIMLTNNIGQPIGNFRMYANYDYLTMPVLFRATFGEKISFFMNTGPYVAFLLKNTTIIKNPNDPIKTNSTENFKRIDMGFTIGMGISIPVENNLAITIEARDNIGLLNTIKPEFQGTFKTQSTNLLLGIEYRFGKKNSSL